VKDQQLLSRHVLQAESTVAAAAAAPAAACVPTCLTLAFKYSSSSSSSSSSRPCSYLLDALIPLQEALLRRFTVLKAALHYALPQNLVHHRAHFAARREEAVKPAHICWRVVHRLAEEQQHQ
jgi:hypothetical protein